MSKLAVFIVIAVLVIAAYFMFPSITGFLVADGSTVAEYCGNGRCSNDEDCGSCAIDCGLCRLRRSDVDVELEWRDPGELCNSTGSVYGFIRLSDELEQGVYYCTVSFAGAPMTSFSIERPGKWNLFAGNMLLNQSHTAEFCCHSYSVDPDFCQSITIPAYC
jgi:hypothetical protein